MNRLNPTTSYRVLFMPYFCAAQEKERKKYAENKTMGNHPFESTKRN